MVPGPTSKRYDLIAAGIFLFILPFTHTVGIRLTCLAIAAVIALVSWYHNPPPAPPCKAPLVFWFVVCLLASLWSIDPEYSWGEFRNEVIYSLLAFAAFYYYTAGESVWRVWRWLLVAACCVLSLHAMINYVRIGDWITAGLVGDRNAYSTYIVVIAPFLFLVVAQTAAGSGARKLVWLTIALALVSGYLTQNRIMWLTLMIEAAVFVFLYSRKRTTTTPKRRITQLAVVGSICAVFSAQFFLVSHFKPGPGETSATPLEQKFSRDLRPQIWSYAVTRIKERQLTGYGYGRGILRSDFRSHFNDPLAWHGHNMMINYVLEAGLLGAIALAWLFMALVWEFWRLYHSSHRIAWELGAFGLSLLLGLTLKTMTDDILVRGNALLFWSLVGMSLGLARRGQLKMAEAPS